MKDDINTDSIGFSVEDAMEKLTIDEKIGLLSGIDQWHTYPVKRLNIPSIRMTDGPNGTRGTKRFNGVPAACFPCGTGLASTFDKDLLVKAGNLMAIEARHKGSHIILGPTTNMQRGPLGGRGFESFSEDPYLAGRCSISIINGIQSQGIAATIKHFVCNDLEDERRGSDSIVAERPLREIYLEPFRLAVKYANPVCFMSGYNKLNGTHCSQNKRLLKEILQDEWKWKGTIMSDWWGTYTTKDAITNGLDIEMPGPTLFRSVKVVKHMIDSRELSIQDLDARVKEVLDLVKYCTNSGIPEGAPEDTENNTPETSKQLRDIAKESIVLLKNDDKLLPLTKEDKIAVIGPNAKYAAFCGGGSASLVSYYTTTPYEGISAKLKTSPPYTVGAYNFKLLPTLATQLTNSKGKTGYTMRFYKKPADYDGDREQFDKLDTAMTEIKLRDYSNEKIDSLLYFIDLEGTFTPPETADYEFSLTVLGTALLYVNDEVVVDNKTKQQRGASFDKNGTVEVKHSIKLKAGENYKVKIEYGTAPTSDIVAGEDFDGAGGLFFGCAKVIDTDDEIKSAVKLAKSVDKVVLCIGLNQEWESEGYDRKNMELPLKTNDLVSAVLNANPNTVVVNQSGTPVEFPWLKECKCLVQAWYGGNEGGNAIADVLFGDYNPSGKLSLSFPFKNVDNPAYLNFKTERGRVKYGEDIFIGYRYYDKLERPVAFPFGHGLSYTEYEYLNLKIFVDESADKLEASLDIKNIGDIDGSETVQLYVSHLDSDTIKPVKELKGFEKVSITARSYGHVKFALSLKDSTSFYDEYYNKWNMEAGNYEVQIGKSSIKIELTEKFEIKKQKLWIGL